MKKLRPFFKNTLVLIISMSVIFISLEIAYRGYRLVNYYLRIVKNYDDPLVIPVINKCEYIFKPNAIFTTKDGITYKINSKGLRDREFEYVHSGSRILVLGDSYVFGWGELIENTYPKLLENILNCEVMNAGIYGYNTVQESEFLKREGMKYGPDLVILGFVMNDAEPQYVIPINPLWETERVKSWFLELVKDRFNSLFKKDIFKLGRIGYNSHAWENFEWRKDRCFRAIKDMKDSLERRKIPFLVVIFPSLEYQSGTVYSYSEYGNYKVITDLVMAYCKKENMHVLNLYPFFEGKKVEYVRQDGGHLNKEGYRIAAEATAAYIKDYFKLSP